MKHLLALRIKRSVVLLRSTTHTIETIAGMMGYSDGYAFSHAFKRHTGSNPTGYRKNATVSSEP